VTAPPQAPEQPPASAGLVEPATELLALVEAQDAVREMTTGQVAALVQHLVAGFDSWYSNRRVERWAAEAAKATEPLLRVLAQSTDAYQARILSAITGRRVRPVGAVNVAELRRGVTHADVYARAASAYRWQQGQLDKAARDLATAAAPQPPDLVSPAEAARTRALVVGDQDVQLAVRNQSQRSMTEAHSRGLITGWRRVIHPELSRGGTCGLCVAASDRLYGPKEPMPLHTRCNCVPMPIRDEHDPGSTLNASDLRRLYSEAGSTSAADLKRTRYRIVEHSERGPVLTAHDATVRTARQAKADRSRTVHKTPEQVSADIRRVRDSLTPALNKAKGLAQADPKKWGGYLSQLEARIRDLDHELAA
jgi:hypothetical protein